MKIVVVIMIPIVMKIVVEKRTNVKECVKMEEGVMNLTVLSLMILLRNHANMDRNAINVKGVSFSITTAMRMSKMVCMVIITATLHLGIMVAITLVVCLSTMEYGKETGSKTMYLKIFLKFHKDQTPIYQDWENCVNMGAHAEI